MDFSLEKYQELVVEKGTHVVQTRSGKPTRIVCTDRKGKYPVIALYLEDGEEFYVECIASGHYYSDKPDSQYDLFIVPKPPVSLGWVVVYKAEPNAATFTSSPCPDKDALLNECNRKRRILLSEPVEIFAKP